MIEILVTLSMDRATLVAAQLFPVYQVAFLSEAFEESMAKKSLSWFLDGAEEMAALAS